MSRWFQDWTARVISEAEEAHVQAEPTELPPRTSPVRGDPDSIDVFAAQGGDRPAGRR